MNDINKALEGANSDWFTIALKWGTQRYVIWLTHNVGNTKVSELEQQANIYNTLDNVNVWGWTNTETDICYTDISTSSDDLSFAERLGKFYNQIAIWDNINMQEIRLA